MQADEAKTEGNGDVKDESNEAAEYKPLLNEDLPFFTDPEIELKGDIKLGVYMLCCSLTYKLIAS